jgi:hypothetical protein
MGLALAAGCSFPGNAGTGDRADAPTLPDPADAEVLTMPDANPATPDAPPPPPDASPPPDAMPGTPDAPPDAQLATCPGYSQIAGGFPAGATYLGMSNGAQFTSARGQCQASGGDIVVIDNATEAAAVAQLVQDPGSPYFWVGVFDPSGGGDNNWVTVRGGSPPYLPWGSGQPTGGNQDCILIGDFGAPYELFDYSCGAPQDYVCECLP